MSMRTMSSSSKPSTHLLDRVQSNRSQNEKAKPHVVALATLGNGRWENAFLFVLSGPPREDTAIESRESNRKSDHI